VPVPSEGKRWPRSPPNPSSLRGGRETLTFAETSTDSVGLTQAGSYSNGVLAIAQVVRAQLASRIREYLSNPSEREFEESHVRGALWSQLDSPVLFATTGLVANQPPRRTSFVLLALGCHTGRATGVQGR
jgi:hypothetical protein